VEAEKKGKQGGKRDWRGKEKEWEKGK